jgi:TonB-linked SusC/RagA family outer membrane protein
VSGYGVSRWANNSNLIATGLLTYEKAFSGHNITATAGVEYQKSRTDATQVEAQGFPVEDLKKLASAATVTVGTSNLTWYSFLSYFARANYNYDRKYLLSVSARYDGSSRFGENNQFGFFPAISLGWVLSEEGFLKDNNLVSFLKLRASYGLTGNAEINNFASLGLFGAEAYGQQSGLAPTQIPNPDLGWENTAQIDAGIDFGFFNDRITGEIDYYRKLTTDLLLDVPVPATSGFSIQTQNIGSVENKGFEFVLNTNNFVGDFRWTTSFNAAINRNKVLSLNEGQDLIPSGSSRYMNVVKVGEPLGVFYGAEYAGVDPQTGDAIWYVNEQDAEGNIIDEAATTNDFNEANFIVVGDPNPDFIGGLTNSFSFKGVELSFMLQGVYGNQVHDAAGGFMSCNACWFDNQTLDQMNYWDQPGDVTLVPEPRLGYSNGDQSVSSRYVYDASYTRLKNVTLGYTFPKDLVAKLRLTNVRVFATAQNYFTFTDYPGWDPEVSTDFLVNNVRFGVDFYAAPQPKTLVFGVNLGF